MAPQLANAFGILGNVVSFLVYLAPVPTFYRVVKKKSSEGFQAIPYSVALFSATLYLYYAFLKKNAFMLLTINGVGCVIELLYLTIFFIYATKQSRVSTTKLILGLNVGSLGFIAACTYYFARGSLRENIVGWICAVFSVCVFVSPLSIMRQVVRTKSVEFMPFTLSFFLTLCAVVWFFYGMLIKDYYIATPNVLGFVFGVAQMVLYVVYKNHNSGNILINTCTKQQVQPAEGDSSSDGKTISFRVKTLNCPRDDSEMACNKHEVEVVVVNYEEA